MLRLVRLDRVQEGAGFEEEYLSDCVLARLDAASTDGDFIVYSCDSPALPAQVAEVIGAAMRPILLHLSNEKLQHEHGYYSQARWVFRSYFDPTCTLPHVTTVPLGYRSGFRAAATALRTPERDNAFVWAFAGQKKSDRKAMADQFERLTPHFAHYTSGWLSDDMLTVEQVCAAYAKTQVVPCPMGNINPDSFRIMEALENGCIPVLKTFYGYDIAKYTFGDHPFIVGNSWADCARRVRQLARNPDQYRARAAATERWYRQFKETLADDIAHIVRTGSDAGCKGSQFDYQRAGKSDRLLKVAFAWHFREKYRLLHRLGRIGEFVSGGKRKARADAP